MDDTVLEWLPDNLVAVITHRPIECGESHLRPGDCGRVLWIHPWMDCETGRPVTSIVAICAGHLVGLWPYECQLVDGALDPFEAIAAPAVGTVRQITFWQQ